MALVSVPGRVVLGGNIAFGHGNANGNTLDASGEYEGWVLCAHKDLSVDRVGFLISSASGSPTADFRIETVNTSTGLPTGTLFGTNTNVVTGTLSNGMNVAALGGTASISRGQIFAVIAKYNSGTSFKIAHFKINNADDQHTFPYKVYNIGTPTVNDMNGSGGALLLGSAADTYYTMPYMFAVNSSSNKDLTNSDNWIAGNSWTPDFDCEVCGLSFSVESAAADDGNWTMALRDNSGTILTSQAFDTDQIHHGTQERGFYYFSTPYEVSAGTEYYCTLHISDPTVGKRLKELGYNTSNEREGDYWNHWFEMVEYTDTAGWVKTSTSSIAMNVLLSKIPDGAAPPHNLGYAAHAG